MAYVSGRAAGPLSRLLRGALLIALVASAGCSTAPPRAEDIGPPPDDAYAKLDRALTRYLFDPSSIQQYAVGEVKPCNLTFGLVGYCVCVEYNAKNRFGGYVGVSRLAVLFKNGKVATHMEVAPFSPAAEVCGREALQERDPAGVRGKYSPASPAQS